MTSHVISPGQSSFRHSGRRLVFAWLALLALMSTSLASSYVHLGVGNVVAGVAIAAIKTAIVAWWFMHLRTSSAMVRLTAVAALFMLTLLLSLSGLDYRTRLDRPAVVQAPRQLAPLVDDERNAAILAPH
jgi:cytochrome c oxidase subunit 4